MLLLTLNLKNSTATGSVTGLKGTVSSSGTFAKPVYTGSSSIVGGNGSVSGAGTFTRPTFTGSATITGLIGTVTAGDSVVIYASRILVQSKITTDLSLDSAISTKVMARSKITTEINLTSLI